MPETLLFQCPIFQNGCPYANSVEANTAFRKNLSHCRSFEQHGCPFKDLVSVEQLQLLLSSELLQKKQFNQELITQHQSLKPTDWCQVKKVCPAFKDGCIFAKALPSFSSESSLELNSCPVWKSGCPFKILVSNGVSLVESLQSNCWDVLVTVGQFSDDHEHDESIFVSKMLKEGTKESHSLAESVQFVKRFRKKQITKELYQLLIRNLYFVYVNLEKLLDIWSKKNENVRKLNFPELKRTNELAKDLEFFYGVNWKSKIMNHSSNHEDFRNMSPATASYVNQLIECAKDQQHGGELLIAHAYTRYLGDLSGGQLLKRMTRRSLNLPAAPRNATTKQISQLPASQVDGTRFYDFLDIDDLNHFKNLYRHSLDSLHLSESDAEVMVKEANVAFRLNMEVFQELDSIAGFLPDESDLIQDHHSSHSTIHSDRSTLNTSSIPPECPFSAMFKSIKSQRVSKSIVPEDIILKRKPQRSLSKLNILIAILLVVTSIYLYLLFV